MGKRRIYEPGHDGRKFDQSLPLKRLTTPEEIREARILAVMYSFSLHDLCRYLNAEESLARCLANTFKIPIRNAGCSLFFHPDWTWETQRVHPTLGIMVLNPKFGAPYGAAEAEIPRRHIPDDKELPVAILALAQYKLGFVPEDCMDYDAIAFRDGNFENLRPDNLVYTGRVGMKEHSGRLRATYNELERPSYRTKCNRCGYRLPLDQEPAGWEFDADIVELAWALQNRPDRRGVTRVVKATVCPVCKNFKDRVWNGSQG